MFHQLLDALSGALGTIFRCNRLTFLSRKPGLKHDNPTMCRLPAATLTPYMFVHDLGRLEVGGCAVSLRLCFL